MPITWRLEVEFVSDWHIGSGTGQAGFIDRLVRRNPADGLPYVPAKTLTGILRDACERLTAGLDGGQPGRWNDLLMQIFGDEPAKRFRGRPLPALISIRPARLDPELRQWLRYDRRLADALTFIKPGVAIDSDTGQALPEHLRMDEMVRCGAVLATTVHFEIDRLPPECHQPAHALLWAGVRTTERIGGKRRRGAGRCILRLFTGQTPDGGGDGWDNLDARADELVDALGGSWSTPIRRIEDTDRAALSPEAASTTATSTTATWCRVPLTITLLDPAIVPRRVTGNLVESCDFVPGTMLVAPLLQRLREITGQSCFPLLASGHLRVMNAYLDVRGSRGLPVPFTFTHAKHDDGLAASNGQAWNSLVDTAPHSHQPKQHRRGYIDASDGRQRPLLAQPALVHVMHNTINDERQRPVSEETGVYSYEAIAAGTTLRSELWLRTDSGPALPGGWTARLAGEVRLGISKKDDYARALLSAGQVEPCNAIAAGATLTVWLASDTLVRGPSLEPLPTLDGLRRALESALGVTLRTSGQTASPYWLRTRRLEGWQSRWGLPKPSMIGIEAGSVAQFDIAGPLPGDLSDRVTALVRRGLGERCGEGYGEILVNAPLLDATLAELKRVSEERPAESPTPPLLADSAFTRLIEREAWRAEMRRRIAGWAAGGDGEPRRSALKWRDHTPQSSQLGRLREHMMNFRHEDASAVIAWLGTAVAAKKWPPDAAKVIQEALATGPTGRAGLLSAALGTDESAPWDGFPACRQRSVSELTHALWPEAMGLLLLSAIHGEMRQRDRSSR